MILANFSSLQQAQQNNRNNKIQKHTNPANKKPSHNPNKPPSNYSQSKPKPQHSIHSYLTQLGIQNVQHFYLQQKSQQQKLSQLEHTQLNKTKFLQSVNRLYKGQTVTKNQNKQQQENQVNNNTQQKQNQQPQYYYNELYQQQKDYQNKFLIKNLEKSINHFKNKLFGAVFCKKYFLNNKNNKEKNGNVSKMDKKAKQEEEKKMMKLKEECFLRSIVLFFIEFYQCYQVEIRKNKNSSSSDNKNSIINEQQFMIKYQDFINKYRLKDFQSPLSSSILILPDQQQKQKQQSNLASKQIYIYNKLEFLANRMPFIYSFVRFLELQKKIIEQKRDEKAKDRIRSLWDLEKWLSQQKNKEIDYKKVYEKFQDCIDLKFTVPFETKLYQVKKEVKNNSQVNQKYQEGQSFSPFKANPIPQSTYKKPYQRLQQQKKKPTIPIPFNFGKQNQNHKASNQTAQHFYSNKWNRNFKAKSVPKSTYQPNTQLQCIKKQHMQTLLKTSQFPKTMQYLQNYNQVVEQKHEQLFKKHFKNRFQERQKVKEIPNFQKLHKNQLYTLEKRKEMNRSNTKPQEFKFSQTRKDKMASTMVNNFIMASSVDPSSTHNQKKKKKPLNIDSTMPQAKSTAKFQAYIQLRKKQKQQKIKQKQQQQQFKLRKQQDLKEYKNILKKRMQNQLVATSNTKSNYNQPKNPNDMTNLLLQNKVNLEQIYYNKPLLMSGVQNNSKSKKQKGNKNNDDLITCYTDAYQPII